MWQLSKHIATEEGIKNTYVIELAALLHDIADWKLSKGDHEAGPRKAKIWLVKLGADAGAVEHVCDIIRHISFKGAGVQDSMKTIEGKIVQDADRLDAIGAIGIARAFAYGGKNGREMHCPEARPELHVSFEQYKSSRGTSINHFYEKLLLLRERMNTAAGRRLASGRHQFMEQFLNEFFDEWNGRK